MGDRGFFFFSSRRRHTRCLSDWSSDVCSSDLGLLGRQPPRAGADPRARRAGARGGAGDRARRPGLRSRRAAGAGGRGGRRQRRRRDPRGDRHAQTRARRVRAEGDALGSARREGGHPLHSSRRGRHRVAGLGADAHAHVPPLVRACGLQGGGRGPAARRRGGHQVRHHRGDRRLRLRLSQGRGGRAPSHPHLALRRLEPPPDVVRLRRGDAGGRRRRGHHPRGRAARRRLSLVGAGGAGREHGGLRGADHAPADGDRGGLPERALAAPQPRHRAPHSEGAPLRGGVEQAEGGAVAARRAEEGDRLRQPDPHLHLPSRAADQGPSHGRGDRQRRGGHGRRHRRVHQGVLALGTGERVSEQPRDTNDLVRQREEKLEALRRRGIDPFGGRYPVTHWAGDLATRLEKAADAELDAFGPVSLAGRLVAMRDHGKTAFTHLMDRTGRIQLYARADELGDDFALFRDLDVGDFIGVTGGMFRTRTGQLTVAVKSFAFLAKSLRPLPEKWHGLKDVETRYRQRYVDLIVNPEVREIFLLRARLVQRLRAFLDARGFLEVETPMMQPIPGGAIARPFATHHNALDMDLYLRIAPELYLKRLVVGGFERVYEINRNFRNEGVSTQHNPEFTMLEFYQAYADYQDLMELTEELLTELAQSLLGRLTLTWGEHAIDLTRPWKRLPFFSGVSAALGTTVTVDTDAASVARAAAAKGVTVKPGAAAWEVWKEVFDELVEPTLVQPTFVVDYPIELSPLAKKKRDHPRLVDRFELFVGRRELANAYSELNDPIDQLARFREQAAQKARGDDEAHWLDEDYVRALEYGMPPAAGEGIGLDRLAMLFANQPSIREVILFPHLRPEGGPA